MHLVHARTVGAAIGILRRDKFLAAFLDHSLNGPQSEQHLNGEDVALCLCETQSRDCEVLVHSHSPAGAQKMRSILKRAGFSVEARPWSEETKEYAREWLAGIEISAE